MRDLLFKNLTSGDKRRRVIVSTETSENNGIKTHTTRHFICLIKEVKKGEKIVKPAPYLYVLKERNNKEHRERFFCRVKGTIYAASNNRMFLINFVHSLRINLKALNKVSKKKNNPNIFN